MEEFDGGFGAAFFHERIVDALLYDDGAHGDGRIGQCLGAGHHVRRYAEGLCRERLAGASEAGDDLVEYQQDAVFVANAAQSLQVALRRHQHPGRASDRFDDDRGDVRRIVQLHQTFQIIGELSAVLGLAAREGIARRIVRVAHVIDRSEHVAEGLAVADHAAYGNAAEADAVVAALASDQDAARAFAADAVVSQRDFQRGIHCFGAGVGEEHPVHALRGDRRQLFRRLEGDGVVHLEAGRVVHGLGLLLDRVDDRAAAVACVDRPKPGDAIEHFAAVLGLIMHILGGHQQAGRGLELAIRGEGNPQRVEVQGSVQMAQGFFVWHVHGRVLVGQPRGGAVR